MMSLAGHEYLLLSFLFLNFLACLWYFMIIKLNLVIYKLTVGIDTTSEFSFKIFGRHCYDIEIDFPNIFCVMWTVCNSRVLYLVLTGLQGKVFCNS